MGVISAIAFAVTVFSNVENPVTQRPRIRTPLAGLAMHNVSLAAAITGRAFQPRRETSIGSVTTGTSVFAVFTYIVALQQIL